MKIDWKSDENNLTKHYPRQKDDDDEDDDELPQEPGSFFNFFEHEEDPYDVSPVCMPILDVLLILAAYRLALPSATRSSGTPLTSFWATLTMTLISKRTLRTMMTTQRRSTSRSPGPRSANSEQRIECHAVSSSLSCIHDITHSILLYKRVYIIHGYRFLLSPNCR